MKRDLPPIDSSKFSFSHRLATADVTDLVPSFRNHLLYDDAADVGFAMRSTKTGEVATFVLARPLTTGGNDNELFGWEYILISEDARRFPALSGLTVHILND